MPDLPPQFTAWPEQHPQLDSNGLLMAYSAGWRGCFPNPEAKERVAAKLMSEHGYGSISDAAHANGWADSGAGKLVIPFVFIRKLWPKAFPGDAQQVGSCVSHSTKNAALLTLACELVSGKPDPVTGKLEGIPDVPPEGEESGVLSPAPIYWSRGYNGDGWSCGEAAERIVDTVGLVVAKNYPNLGVDLTNVTRSIEHLYGSKKPPEAWQTEFAAHKIHSVAEVGSFEELRDGLFNGYGASTCGSEGWSSTRNEDGVSKRSGSWSHAMACLGVDDRDTTKAKYGEPLVWNQNSWGNWNSGPLRIMGTEIDALPGGFWTTWSSYKRRDIFLLSNVAGWPARTLPSYGFEQGLN